MNHWILLAILFVLAGVMFYAIERFGKGKGLRASADKQVHVTA
jgi:hypothetical protein